MFILPAVLLILVWVWPYVWFKAVREKLQVEVQLGRTQSEPDRPIPVTILVRNLSWFPCPFVKVSVELPGGLSANAKTPVSYINCTTFLWMRQQVVIEACCYGTARGTHRLRHATIHVNDGLGLRELFVSVDLDVEIAILPRFTPIDPSAGPMREISGKLEVVRWLFPDESLLRGIRQYQSGDPFKHIAWLASARSGQWMTRQFSSSTEAQVCIVVNSQFFHPHWSGTNSTEFDSLCSLAATWGVWLAKRGYRLVFLSNATIPRDPVRTWHGEQRPEGLRLLLGRAYPYTNRPLEQLLLQAHRQVRSQVPILLFTSFITPSQWQLLRNLSREGRELTIVAGPSAALPAVVDSGVTIIYSTVERETEVAVNE